MAEKKAKPKKRSCVLYVRLEDKHERKLDELIANRAAQGKPHSREAVVREILEAAK